jgi:hypothetical protein
MVFDLILLTGAGNFTFTLTACRAEQRSHTELTMRSSPNEPTFLLEGTPLHWQMTRCERYAFIALLDIARPEVAIEIGTYKGGSLQVMARRAQKVYSLDINSSCKEELASRFPNVDFHAGDSKQLIPEVLKTIAQANEKLGFVLIDGDHSTEGVRNDINAVLRHVPSRPVYVVFHDSFHPASRRGILQAAWKKCLHVHYVEVDFIPGVFHYDGFDTAEPRSMFGGLALALMLPEERTGELVIHQSQKGLFQSVLRHSVHHPLRSLWRQGGLRDLGHVPLEFLRRRVSLMCRRVLGQR